MRQLCAVLLIALILVGCQSRPQPSLFETSPCKAPCWENVTPGVTTKEDALKIFAKFADKNGVVFVNDAAPYEDDIRFGSADLGSVFAFTLNGRISMMQFQGSFGGPLTLQQAITLFGQPESVWVEETGIYTETRFFNPSKGIVFGYINSGNVDYQIKPSQVVGLFWFFDPSKYDLFLNGTSNGHGNEIKQSLRPWNGYGTYLPPVTPSP